MDTNLNGFVLDWSKATLRKMDAKFDELNIEHSPSSKSPIAAREALKYYIQYKLGVPAVISYKFPRHMVFVAKGVGNGVPAALAGTSATKRKPKDWFNKVLDEEIEELADGVAERTGDAIVNSLRIR